MKPAIAGNIIAPCRVSFSAAVRDRATCVVCVRTLLQTVLRLLPSADWPHPACCHTSSADRIYRRRRLLPDQRQSVPGQDEYIRLTNLVPELLDYVDEGRIKMRPAVELSFLDEDSQRDVVDEIDLNDATPSHDQTIRMRKFFEEGKLTTEAIQAIMSEEKPNQREKIVLRGDRVRQLIPKNIPISQTEDFVCKALEHYNKFLRSRADRDSR